MKWVVYNILFLIIYPFLLPGFLLRMLKRGGYAARMGDRFALYPEDIVPPPVLGRTAERSDAAEGRASQRPVWIHAVSVGEVQVAGQLMREWRKVEPDVRFVFSTTSSTGWLMAEKELASLGRPTTDGRQPTTDILIYNPLDFPTFVKAALLTFRPRAIVLTESEIWPNFIRRAKKMGIPLFLINARVSDRSAPRYKAARFFFGELFRSFAKIFAQSDLDAERIRATGCRGNIEVTGSFKFDVAKRNPAKEEELRTWIWGSERERLRSEVEVDGGGKILLGGSTWPGEDEVLLKIYKNLLHRQPQPSTSSPILVIAPRHFEKADAIEANIKAAGFACVRRSRGEGTGDAAGETHRGTVSGAAALGRGAVFLADTTGELMGLYGIADVVFVGKSLCAHGSQNMIEPCLCGKTTFVGPYTENFRPVMSDLLAAQAITQVKDATELEARILAAFAGEESTAANAKAAVEKRCGVVARCVAEIRALIPASC